MINNNLTKKYFFLFYSMILIIVIPKVLNGIEVKEANNKIFFDYKISA